MKKSSKKNISGVTEDANKIVMVAMNFVSELIATCMRNVFAIAARYLRCV